MRTALIIGASRGIGREFVRQLLSAGWKVFATARDEASLQALKEEGAHALKVDVAISESLAGLTWQLDGERLDLAVYVAGARHNPRNIVRALRRACRVAWYGVPPLPRDAQCCVCWADVGSGGDGAATLCTECGVGASTPMSYACEPCRSGWRAVRDECPVCLAAGWPVCFPPCGTVKGEGV